jgi:hypothetical protein
MASRAETEGENIAQEVKKMHNRSDRESIFKYSIFSRRIFVLKIYL